MFIYFDFRESVDVPLFTATIQFPLNPENQPHPPIFIFNIQETKICIDPLLCRWLLYKPRTSSRKVEFIGKYSRVDLMNDPY